jgi:NADH-quinone oxidoreductase subunit G
VAEAAGVLAAAYPSARFLPALRRGNVIGALDMGLAPGVLPGRISLGDGKDWYGAESGWSEVPSVRGLDTEGMLRALEDGSMRAVVLLGADPLGDFPDLDLAAKALEKAEFVLAVDCVSTASVKHADVVLPVATHHERAGTTTNIEGRVLRVGQKLTPPVLCWPDWMIASELADRLGGDLGVGTVADLWDEIERLAPSHTGLTRAALDSPSARDGVVVPLKAARVTLGRRGANWESKIDPMATPGIESVELQGAISRVGTAEPQGSYEAESDEGGTEQPPPQSTESTRVKRPSMLSYEASPATGKSAVGESLADPEDGSLRLVSPRRLYDHGVQMLESESLSGLVKPLVAKVNPAELAARSLTPGSVVRLGSNGSAFDIEVVADSGVHLGMVEVSANVRSGDGGPGAAMLIKSANHVTDVQMVPK